MRAAPVVKRGGTAHFQQSRRIVLLPLEYPFTLEHKSCCDRQGAQAGLELEQWCLHRLLCPSSSPASTGTTGVAAHAAWGPPTRRPAARRRRQATLRQPSLGQAKVMRTTYLATTIPNKRGFADAICKTQVAPKTAQNQTRLMMTPFWGVIIKRDPFV